MRHLVSMGKIMGTLCMSRVIDIRRGKSLNDHKGGGEGLQVRVRVRPGQRRPLGRPRGGSGVSRGVVARRASNRSPSVRSPGRFESDAGAAPDHDDSLSEESPARAGWKRCWLRCS